MGVTGIGGAASLSLQALIDMRNQLDDLQRQLGTGKKATSYSGLGLDRSLVVGLHSQLSAVSSYQQTITQVGVRLELMQTALSQFSSIAQDTKSTIMQSQFALNGDTTTQDQKNTLGLLNQLVGLLNTGVDGRYLFAGRSVDQLPVEDTDAVINGSSLRAGLKQVIDERRQADLGTSGLGRLSIGSPTGTSVSLTEDAAPPFGFKLVGATTDLTGATVTGPTGAPPALTVDLGAVPNAGETVRFTFTLPDGTTRDLTLIATNSATPAAGEFTIGGTATATRINMQAALGSALTTLANTELVAASAIAAGNDFFNTDASNPPQRVGGPPFDTATTLVNGSANTVLWYAGDDGTDDPRSTAIARADQSLAVSYGVRANEDALTAAIRSFAVFAAVTFSSSDPDAEGQYVALRQRVGEALVGTANEQKLTDIQGQLAGAQVALNSAKDRHEQTDMTLQNLLQSVEGVSTEEVAAQILALQTSLQATLQTTAMLLQTNLLQYL
jgi:flagellar hook-associated protein 3 FlgL